jgi:hypothetical protein
VRIEPSSQADHQLLEYFNRVIGNGVYTPAKFPLRHVSLKIRRIAESELLLGVTRG